MLYSYEPNSASSGNQNPDIVIPVEKATQVLPIQLWANMVYKRSNHITKTYLYNFDPLKPHFYIVKLGLRGVYIILLNSAQEQIVDSR